jgi:hypothetical protein
MNADEARPPLDDYLSHMLEATRLACEYVQGIEKEDFPSLRTAALSRRLSLERDGNPIRFHARCLKRSGHAVDYGPGVTLAKPHRHARH